MFTWWKRKAFARLTSETQRYRPRLEDLERREMPTVSISVGPSIDISRALGNQTEQSIVVNPLNPNQVFAFANSDDIALTGTFVPGLFSAWSADGGVTWHDQNIFTDTTLPDAACCDPQAAWDKFGNLFLAYETNDLNIAFAISTDGGQTFRTQLLTSSGTGLGFADQPSIAVGPGPFGNLGSVWVSYNTADPTLAVAPHLESQVAVVTAFGIMGAFHTPVLVPGSDAVAANFGDIAIGPHGEAMVTYQASSGPEDGPSTIWFNVDPDGMGPLPWGPRQLATATNVGPLRGPGNAPTITFPAQSNNLGIDAEPNLAWDRSNGPHRGRVYLVYTDAPTTNETDLNTNIFVRYSDNRGATWSAPVRVNDDTGGASQFNPAIAVDQSTGNVGVAWYDARNDASANQRVEMWATVSINGGVSFLPNFKVSSGQTNSALSEPPASGVRPLGVGDFNKIDFVQGNLQIVWADNSSTLAGNPDVPHLDTATARVKVRTITTPTPPSTTPPPPSQQQGKVSVIFPIRWRLVNMANAIYLGRITIINRGPAIQGPITLTIRLPRAGVNFLSPTNTQAGNFVTFTINANLPHNVPVRFSALLSNPMHVHLPTALVGFASHVS